MEGAVIVGRLSSIILIPIFVPQGYYFLSHSTGIFHYYHKHLLGFPHFCSSRTVNLFFVNLVLSGLQQLLTCLTT